jgi:4-amino-4-deoxy-L-arabinose transferase-like glycosyltransferase
MNYAFNFLKRNVVLIAIMIVASVLRFYHLQFQSPWDDELATMIESNPLLNQKEAYNKYLEYESMPPLYFIMLRWIFSIFGYKVEVLRFISAIGGVASIYSIYLLGKELHTKRVGVFAALILSVNQMHIYYSQEGRPYSYLVCFTALSFYAMLRFVKNPSWLNSTLYVLFTTLMIYSQYIVLIIIPIQFFLLLYFLFGSPKEKRPILISRAIFSGLLIIILYIPAYLRLFTNLEAQSSWIPAPGPEPFTSIFKEYFGNSEMVLTIAYILIVFFFMKLLTEKTEEGTEMKIQTLRSNFLILIVWIIPCILIPLIRSYIVVPMIIPRYFIHLIPAVILIMAIGLDKIDNLLSRSLVLGSLVVFSLTDIVVIKDFYNRLTKPQYTQCANFINEHRKPGEAVVARVGWHYGYYFADSVLVWAHLEDYISRQMRDTTHLKNFWYAGVHDQQISMSNTALSLLERFYYKETIKGYYETEAIHYERKEKNTKYIDLKNFSPIAVDRIGVLVLNDNQSTTSNLNLSAGSYRLVIKGRSFPTEPLNNINAHLTLKLNEKIVGGAFLNPGTFISCDFSFNLKENSMVSLQIAFDNDLIHKKVDRYAEILWISVEKKN